ncbi:MAG: hypothetical protein J6X42_00400 [Alphaproteobacteria bacterium]|nr:hypothetical protein [Alphaproteobacteria bacterium]
MLGWLLVIIVVAVIFSAHKLPAFKGDLKVLADKGLAAAKKGKEKAEEKINAAKEKRKESKEAKKEDSKEDKAEEEDSKE